MRRHRIVALATTAALAASCGPKTEVVNTEVADMNFTTNEDETGRAAPSTPQASYTETAPWGEWQTRSEVDPMNDRQSMVAEIEISGHVHDVRVTTRCEQGSSKITYQIDGFDKQGNSSAYETHTGTGIYNSVVSYNRVEWRADEGESHGSDTNDPRFSNRAEIAWYQVVDAARARRLTLKVFFADGDEVYQLDQRQAAFRRAIDPCLPVQAPERQPAAQSGVSPPSQSDALSPVKEPADQPPTAVPPVDGDGDHA